MKKLALAAVVAFATVFSAGHISAQTALKDVATVRDGIIYVGMAYEISEQCDGINARLFRGLNYLQSLRRHASDLGYSDAEIDAYINDDAEKDRLEGIARAQLASLGVVPDQKASYCTVGRAQIDANTRVGWLLR
ncbi:DUF5333 domain-containing protein [Yoonia sp. GPGPB17]|uniref:DUF5333 domain-containing protein n=1 Tax=Yoonia sp. GPGPB17 TaxID=3026147 RepID=UPI0030BCB01E